MIFLLTLLYSFLFLGFSPSQFLGLFRERERESLFRSFVSQGTWFFSLSLFLPLMKNKCDKTIDAIERIENDASKSVKWILMVSKVRERARNKNPNSTFSVSLFCAHPNVCYFLTIIVSIPFLSKCNLGP